MSRKNKADLYRHSHPGRSKSDRRKSRLTYQVGIGCWESGKYVAVKASSVEEAISVGRDYCHSDDDVVEVQLNGRKVWDAYGRL